MLERLILIWIYSLTFLSGVLNTIGIVFFSSSLSHFTGSISNLVTAIFNKNFNTALYIFLMIFFFAFGSFVSGFFTNERTFNFQKRYGFILLYIGICLGIITFFWRILPFPFLIYLPFLLGLQNGMMLGYKGVIIRTTHISGHLTDFGAYLGHYIRGNKGDLKKSIKSLISILSFMFGGVLGIFSYDKFNCKFLYFVAFFYILTAVFYFFIRKRFFKKI